MATAMQIHGDRGKLMRANLPGTCAECLGSIVPGQAIYFRSPHNGGPRHQSCVDGSHEAAPENAAPREASRAAPPAADRRDAARATRADDRRLWSDETDRRWAEGEPRPAGENDATPRARGATAAVGQAAERRDDGRVASDDAYVAPARATEFGRAGDRDAIRAEFRALVRLQIEFLERLERLLA